MKLAVFFPGIGYHCDKPLLYYSRKLTQECGYDEILLLDYTYDGGNIRGDEEKMQQAFECLYAQAEKKLKDIDFSLYSDILFVSKSVGTIIASAFAEAYGINCAQIMYTPLEQTYRFRHENAVAFIGDKDPWSDIRKVQRLSETQNVPISVYEGCNHSLETENCMKNLEILQVVMAKTRDYMKQRWI